MCYIYKVNKYVWSDDRESYGPETYRESKCVFDEEFGSLEAAREAVEEDADWYEQEFFWLWDTEYVWYDRDWSQTREGGIRYSITKYWPK